LYIEKVISSMLRAAMGIPAKSLFSWSKALTPQANIKMKKVIAKRKSQSSDSIRKQTRTKADTLVTKTDMSITRKKYMKIERDEKLSIQSVFCLLAGKLP